MRNLILTAGALAFLSACDNAVKTDANLETHDFFPVNSFFQQQVNEVDSFKLPIHKYFTVGKKTDSILISQAQFDSLAKDFTEIDINDPALKSHYKETSFADQSIPSVTFTYSTPDRKLVLQRLDVVINPDPVKDDQVKSMYLEKVMSNGDSTVVKKMYWKTGQYFQVVTSKTIPGGSTAFTTIKVAWSATD